MTITTFLKKTWRAITLRDRAAKIEIEQKYGNREWVQRNPQRDRDLDAPLVNANVYIATRAISDAIKSLPFYIAEVESVGGVEREIKAEDHPAMLLVQKPNTEHTWSDLMDYAVKAFLNDGNAIFTIERQTGPFQNIELWPRDPRLVQIDPNSHTYKFGRYTANQISFPRNRIVHIRDMDVTDPFWGTGRINTVREEIMMDYLIARFNSNFFENGATLNLMFTPDNNLTEDQHMQIVDALSNEIDGVKNAFKTFVNRYAGKYEYPDQKHKDIAFGELLKSNRERIFGVFGLPPFRGGVMEYANYANALAQDKDFWLNTVRPVVEVLLNSLNKQAIQPIYGDTIRLCVDWSKIPAIVGDTDQVIERLLKLKKEGIVSAEYVREQLDISEDAAPEPVVTPPATNPDGTPYDNTPPANDQQDPKKGATDPKTKPTKDEKAKVKNALSATMADHRQYAMTKLNDLTVGGLLMTVLCDPQGQGAKVFPPVKANRTLATAVLPVFEEIAADRLSRYSNYSPTDPEITALMRRVRIELERIVDVTTGLVQNALSTNDDYDQPYHRLLGRVRSIFGSDRTDDITAKLLNFFLTELAQVTAHEHKTTRSDR